MLYETSWQKAVMKDNFVI